MSILDNIVFAAFLCIIGGAATACQGAVNATFGRFAGQGLSSTIVFCVGAIVSCIYFLIEVKGQPASNMPDLMAQAPWWSWFGGPLGAIFVIINILSIPKLGAGTTTAIIVSVQLMMGCIIDNFQILGVQKQRDYTLWRGLATVGLMISTGIIAKF
ncbi:hypothetical protein BGW41_003992 [Actinomortierella wolfii]|nr:hypothetical protein BGW41_003992 [Actinomortierella wolfii]